MPVDKKRSMGTYEGKCLALIGEAGKFAEENAAGLSETGRKLAEAHIKAIQDQFDRMNKRWEDHFKTELEDKDENLHDELDKKVTETRLAVNKAMDNLHKLIDKPLASSNTALD